MKKICLVLGFILALSAVSFGEEIDYAKMLDDATKGNAEAQFSLGQLFFDAKLVKQDYEKAFYWFKKAAENGHPIAQSNLGLMYYNGKGISRNYNEAFYWFKKATEKDNDNAIAQNYLGIMYSNGYGVAHDYQKALECYKKAAEQGLAEAQGALGLMYAKAHDYKQAVEWYKKAVEQGDSTAQFNLGNMYFNGEFLEQDYKQAYALFKKAAEQGHTEAQFNLGLMYEKGQGVKQDFKQAADYYKKAAEKEHAEAQFNLGNIYLNGKSVKHDYEQAFELFKKLAEQGNTEAQFNLGLMYEKGQGVKQDLKQAVAWYRNAANANHVKAQYNLGVMYWNGQGVNQDDENAEYWLNKAANNGDSNAKDALEITQSERAAKIKRAQIRAEEEKENSYQTVNYNDVQRNPEQYKGKRIKFTGRVVQVVEAIDIEIFDISLTDKDSIELRITEDNFYNNTWYATYKIKKGESRILEKDHITVYGECRGTQTYQAIMGNVVTIPSIAIEFYRQPGSTPSYNYNLLQSQPRPQLKTTAQLDAIIEDKEEFSDPVSDALDDMARDFVRREKIPASVIKTGDIYVIRSYMAQFKAIKAHYEEKVDMYSLPNTGSSVVANLRSGDRLTADAEYVSNQGGSWYYVHFNDKLKGWVNSKFIVDADEIDEDTSSSQYIQLQPQSYAQRYTLTDEEYKQMLKDPWFAEADKTLNTAWRMAKKSMKAKDFEALKASQNKWISSGRDDEASELLNKLGTDKEYAYGAVTQGRAKLISHLTKGQSPVKAVPTGDKVNVRNKPVNGKVLFQVSRTDNDSLIVDKNPINSGGEEWYRVLYRGGDSDLSFYSEASGFIVGRFIQFEALQSSTWALMYVDIGFEDDED